jgi:antitoxin component of MazEF toxin-antitoxin module
MTSLTKHLTKHGNSYAIIIDRAILDLLKIDPMTPLEISTPDGESLVITPKRSSAGKKLFKKNLAKIHLKHGKALKRLAED